MSSYIDDRIMSDFEWPDDPTTFTEESSCFDLSNEDTSPGLTMSVKHNRLREFGIRIAKITYYDRSFHLFLDRENKMAVLIIPDEHYDAFFPLDMTIRDAIYYLFGEKHIFSNIDSLHMPMSKAPFCIIRIQ